MNEEARGEKRWQISRRLKVAKIRDAAVSQFCEHGYAGSSLQHVADAVGMHKATLYHYFESKELLLADILDFAHDQIAEIRDSVDEMDARPVERLRALLTRQTYWYLENVDLARVTFHEWTNVGPELIEGQTEKRRAFDKFLRGLIHAVQNEGSMAKAINISLAANYVTGAMNAAPAWFAPDGALSASDVAVSLTDFSFRALGVSDHQSAGATP